MFRVVISTTIFLTISTAFAQISGGLSGGLGSPAASYGSGAYGYGSGAAGEEWSPEQQLLNVQMVLDKIKEAKSAIANPANDITQNCADTPICSYRDMCLDLRKNRNSKVLYRNSLGEEVGNYPRLKLDQQVNQCLNSNESQRQGLSNQISQQNSMLKLMSESQKTALRLQKELNQAVIKNKDSEKYIRVQMALSEIMQESTKGAYGNHAGKDYIRLAQTKAGVKLSKATVDAWNKSFQGSVYGFASMSPGSESEMPQVATTEDPFFDPRLLNDPIYAGGIEKMNGYKEQFAREDKRVQGIFEEAQRLSIQVLNGKRTEKNKNEIDNLIKRIETAKFKAVSSNSDTCASPNAYYSFKNHTVHVCPQRLKYPRGALLTTLAHELGHSVDPCVAAYDLCKVKASADEKSEEEAEAIGFSGYSLKASESKNRSAVTEVVMAGVHFAQNPLSSVVKCLQNEETSIGAKLASPEERTKLSQAMTESIYGAGGPKSTQSPEEKLAIEKKYAACASSRDGTDDHSQMQEASGDWFSAEVIRLRVIEEANPLRKREIAQESMMSRIATGCFGTGPELEPNIVTKLEEVNCLITDEESRVISGLSTDRSHPANYKRVNDLLMAVPEIANVMGCATTPKKERCE